MQAHHLLAELYAYRGQMGDVIAHFQKARELAVAAVPAAVPQLDESLGIAYLHKSAFDNGVHHKPGARCLLSPQGMHAVADLRDAERAIQHFTTYLARTPDELEVRWLLNLAYMTTGGYPDRVPPAHLIPPAAFASAEDVGRFVDVAPQAGLDCMARPAASSSTTSTATAGTKS